MQGLDLASYLVMYYPSFCEQFLEFGGVTLIINRGLLMCRKASLLLRTMEVLSQYNFWLKKSIDFQNF